VVARGHVLSSFSASGRAGRPGLSRPEARAGRSIGAVFNPGAFTHTSVALHDAIEAARLPVIELHISNVHNREEFRHQSWISPVSRGIIIGLGVHGYPLAIRALHRVAGTGYAIHVLHTYEMEG
jgi:hypothetical protein